VRVHAATALFALATFLAAGCSIDRAPREERTTATRPQRSTVAERPSIPRRPVNAPGPYEPGRFKQLMDELISQVGFQPRIREIVLGPTIVDVELANPATPFKVDRWAWSSATGHFEGPEPVRLPDKRAVVRELFALSDVRFDVVRRLVAEGNKVEIEGAEISTMILRRNLPFTSRLIWLVNVNGARESKQLRADANGRVYQVI
jgi:hypothetical protein